ncbi:hypothetical protein BU23DRAFT_552362, partial [Bimuria novae-zelandiae CBS 107.79]
QRPRQAVALYKELMDVLHRKGVFEKHGVDLSWQSFADYTDPADWWQIQSCTDELKELAIYALSINPTTGAAERNWSEHRFLHNKVRNCLVNARVKKLDAQFFDLLEVPEQVDADEHEDDGQLLDYTAEQVHKERPEDPEDTQHT